MDEQSLVRQAFKHMEPPKAMGHVYLLRDGSVAVHPMGQSVLLNSFDSYRRAQHVAHIWNRSLMEIQLFQRRVVKLDPSYAGVFDMFKTAPQGLTAEIARQMWKDAGEIFGTIVLSQPGTMLEKFEAMGSPRALAHWCGASKSPLTTSLHVMELEWEFFGNRPEPRIDRRIKSIIEPATGKTWPSIKELSWELGCAEGTLYNHLRGNRVQPAVRGRVFEYEPSRPMPGSIAAMTEDEKDAERQYTRAMGFVPNF